MQEVNRNRSIDGVLIELEQVLRDERSALLVLDAASIDAINCRKAKLEAELATCVREHHAAASDRLNGIKRQLQENLVLLVHARDQIHQRLGFVPAPIVSQRASTPAVSGCRLNLRG